MLDILQILFWSITYILVIISGLQNRKERKLSMPLFAAVQNLSWEFAALLNSRGFWGHIVWFSLDLIIIFLNASFLCSKRNRLFYLTSLLPGVVLFIMLFRIPGGMLFSSFIIDLLMAIFFLLDRKRLSPKLRVPIAVTKLLGDVFAGLYYAPQSNLVGIIACIVFMCNVCYLYLCMEESGLLERYFK